MAISLVAPALVMMTVLLRSQYLQAEAQFEQQLQGTTRAIAVATEREVSRARATIEALAVDASLEAGDFATFETEARAAAAGGPGWIVLVDDQQRQIFNTRLPRGAALPVGGFPSQAWAELKSGRTRVSGVVTSPLLKSPVVAIDKPVLVAGRLYAMRYIQEPSAFRGLLTQARLPSGWIGAMVDQNGRIITRNVNAEESVGKSATQDLRRQVRLRREGLMNSRTLEGARSRLAFNVTSQGWTVVIAVPRSQLEAAALRSMGGAVVAFGLLIGLGGLVARMMGRRISTEVRQLAADAAELGAGRLVEAKPGMLVETAVVSQAMSQAARELRQRDERRRDLIERQGLLVNELNHRVKNTLTTVQSLARQTFGATEAGSRPALFVDRLLALSEAHNLLTANSWRDVDLRDLAGVILKAYGQGVVWSGPAVALEPRIAISLVFVLHELATNAAKYGALSGGEGRAELSWRLDEDGRLDLIWEEQGGPPAAPPSRQGFGSRLISTSIERELKGRLEMTWRPEGLRCAISVPLESGHEAPAPARDSEPAE